MHEKHLERLLKKSGIPYISEAAKFLDHIYSNPDKIPKLITNNTVEKVLKLDRIKSSKILSSLAKSGFIIKNIKKNEYSPFSLAKFELICLKRVMDESNVQLSSLNSFFNKSYRIFFCEKLGINTFFNRLLALYPTFSPSENLYIEAYLSEFAFSIPYEKHTPPLQKIIEQIVTKKIFNLTHERYLALKKHIARIKSQGSNKGTVYYIIPIMGFKRFCLQARDFLSPDISDFYIKLLSLLKDGLKEHEEDIKNSILLPIIVTDREQFNNLQMICNPHVFQFYSDHYIQLSAKSVLYCYGQDHARNIAQSYMQLFESLVSKISDEIQPKSNPLLKANIGELLFDFSIQQIDKELKATKKMS
ncbi:MAG: hypothetical protein ACTSRW_13945 [Candidatus Helarchaeota archaeon]